MGDWSRRRTEEHGMSNLVVLGLGNRDDAERVMDLAGDLAKQHLLELEDVAYAYKDDKGKVRIHQAVSLTGAGAASGALWGTLIGMLFLMPLAGLAIGASATTDRVIEAIKPFNPTVIQTSLSHDREEELVRALQS
jgi:uncharacterized membrane protein